MAEADNIGLLPVWEPDNAADATVDIVFVHGLGGDRKDTWTYEANDAPPTFWPLQLLPKQCPKARILTFGYNADFFHFYRSKKHTPVGTKIDDHSAALLHELANLRSRDKSTDRPIIFVAHSLGGLVCANALARYHGSNDDSKTLVDATRGVLFLGTPFEGSTKSKPGKTALQLVRWLGLETNTSDIEDLNKDSEKLAQIRNEFLKFLNERLQRGGSPVKVTCYFETLESYVVKKREMVSIGVVVGKESATLPGHDPIPVRANHSKICKFAGGWDGGYESVSGTLARWIEEMDDGFDADKDKDKGIHVSGDIAYHSPSVYGGVLTGHVVSSKKDGNVIIGSTGNTYHIGKPETQEELESKARRATTIGSSA